MTGIRTSRASRSSFKSQPSLNDGLDGAHQVFVEVRRDGLSSPMKPGSRRKKELLTAFSEASPSSLKSLRNAAGETPERKDTRDKYKARESTHYTIRSLPDESNQTCCQRLLCCESIDDAVIDETRSAICRPTKFISTYLLWAFRTGFTTLLASNFFFFMLLILIFSGLIYLVGFFMPHCFQPNFGQGGIGMNDAFTLSWTTFSTVGYGNIYPSLSYELPEDENIHLCAGISFLCSLESFVGVLYAGFCGAILFSKVLRVQSSARVLFSDPIVIRYGTGVLKNDYEDLEKCSKLGNEMFPCPILEFRLMNTLSDTQGGEILDAQLSAVAIINVEEVAKRLNVKDKRANFLKSTGFKKLNVPDSKASLDNIPEIDSRRSGKTVDSVRSGRGTIRSVHTHELVEDADSDLGSTRVFANLTIEPPDHPFFRRVWVARHVLNESSPLLTAEAKKMIKENNGHWPECDYERVRDSIKFSQIAVSLSGVSNISASSVYANKLYDFVDINVGYQFASVLYKDDREVIRVDADLIHDVYEQNGGGGEPF